MAWDAEDRRDLLAAIVDADTPDDGWTAELVRRAEDAMAEGAELIDADDVHARARAELAAARRTGLGP